MLKSHHKFLILIAAALAGTMVYKVQKQLTAPGTSESPGHNMYTSVTGPGSLLATWKASTAARDRRTSPSPTTEPETSDNDMLLLQAAARGDKDAVEKRLAMGTRVDSRDGLRRTPLMYASWNGYDDIVTRLIAAGANPEFKDSDGNNAFDYAAGHGLISNLEFLLKRTRMADEHHYTEYATLIDAAFSGDASKLPEGKGTLASVNRINPEGVAPLFIVAGNGSVALMEAMIARGAQVNLTNSLHQTALHWAAWNNQPQTIELLLAKGASIEAADLAGNTALIMAAKNNSADAVNVLLKHGADRYATNKDGKTPAIIAEDEDHDALAALLK